MGHTEKALQKERRRVEKDQVLSFLLWFKPFQLKSQLGGIQSPPGCLALLSLQLTDPEPPHHCTAGEAPSKATQRKPVSPQTRKGNHKLF